jgi:hypothetical protein
MQSPPSAKPTVSSATASTAANSQPAAAAVKPVTPPPAQQAQGPKTPVPTPTVASVPPKPASKPDATSPLSPADAAKRFQGTWRVVSAGGNVSDVAPAPVVGYRLVAVRGDRISIFRNQGEAPIFDGTFRIVGTKPDGVAEIDMTDSGRTYLGLVTFDRHLNEDGFRLIFRYDEKQPRPTDFGDKSGNTTYLDGNRGTYEGR